jgi:poly(glycerol-phosphate) alpha-glucosyltransferase
MLDPWALAQRRWIKRAAWHLFERGNLERAGAVQALCSAELELIRAQGVRSPVAIIPNAVSLPPLEEVPATATLPPWSPGADRVLLFLSRFHAKKGVEPLLRAWTSVQSQAKRAGWRLVLLGYGDEGRLALQVAEAQRRGELAGVEVGGPCFGAGKAAALSAASAFVLPSLSEGQPMAALEAMAHRLPCLLSAACNLPLAFSAGAALPAEPEPTALAAVLEHLFSLSAADRSAMGRAGRDLVAAQYSWPRVARHTWELYTWILGGGERPEFVQLCR